MITGMPRIAIAVNDFETAVATFREKFGMPVIDISDSSVDSLGAKLAMCVPHGGSNIELMCPADPKAPLSQSLDRFLKRRGEGLFALMLEASVPDDEAELLANRGLNVLPLMAGAGGRDIHPKSTHGVLIRIYPENSFRGQQDQTDHALSLSGINRVIVAVHDIDEATSLYRDKLGLPADSIAVDKDRGVKSTLCHPPKGGVIELVAVVDGAQPFAAAVDEFLRTRGEGMFALVLQTRDHADEVLSGRGLSVGPVGNHIIEIAPGDAFGARIYVEQRS